MSSAVALFIGFVAVSFGNRCRVLPEFGDFGKEGRRKVEQWPSEAESTVYRSEKNCFAKLEKSLFLSPNVNETTSNENQQIKNCSSRKRKDQ